MTFVYLLLVFGIGLVILYFGAEATLKGSVSIARRMGISPLVIGLTLVAFGTSAPELSLDVTAAFRGQTDLALGDLVGSNIANIGLILGVGALVNPLKVHMRLLRAEIPIAVAAALPRGLAADGTLSRQDGLIMLAVFVVFLGYTVRSAKQESSAVKAELREAAESELSVAAGVGLAMAGLVGLVCGAQFMVYSAVEMARLLGISELLIGLTIVAIGTSPPELATAVVAAYKKEADIVVGNVVGSNIFNLWFILALVAVIRPLKVPAPMLQADFPILAALTVLLAPMILLRGMVLSRIEGGVLVVSYLGFLGFQAWRSLN